jgi:UDP-N-acetylglucosamine 2-epimerase (non-hydrolysing)
VPVVHLEAGLRTGDRFSPFPEEVNRRIGTQLADLHLAATKAAKQALVEEGVRHEQILVTGNTVVDALLWAMEQPSPELPASLSDLAGEPGSGPRTILVTAHRRESWGPELVSVGRALGDIARACPDHAIVLPLHMNPMVRASILPQVLETNNIRVIEPLGYLEFVHVLRRAELVLTDSGGVQEEAPTVKTPVLVMREHTERHEALTHGCARLVGTSRHAIVETTLELVHDGKQRKAMVAGHNPFGDGRAAARIIDALRHLLLAGPRPAEFLSDPPVGSLATEGDDTSPDVAVCA